MPNHLPTSDPSNDRDAPSRSNARGNEPASRARLRRAARAGLHPLPHVARAPGEIAAALRQTHGGLAWAEQNLAHILTKIGHRASDEMVGPRIPRPTQKAP